jgi:hypothetical protein
VTPAPPAPLAPLTYDLCLAWNWEYDAPFVAVLGASLRAHGQTLLEVTPSNLAATIADLDAGRVQVRACLDRASEADPRFLPLDAWAKERGVPRVNPHERSVRAADKSAMHRALFAQLRTPYTIVLAPHAADPLLAGLDLSPLGPCFTIKPAHGGGGEGVVERASTLAEVLAARARFPEDEYLLQTHLVPAAPGGRAAWFRVLYCAGEIYPCWWDTATHVYTQVTAAEEVALGLGGLRSLTKTIARVSGLRLFSTEIALLEGGALSVVDYANDPIDLRPQSTCQEGVPDAIVRAIAERLQVFTGTAAAAVVDFHDRPMATPATG